MRQVFSNTSVDFSIQIAIKTKLEGRDIPSFVAKILAKIYNDFIKEFFSFFRIAARKKNIMCLVFYKKRIILLLFLCFLM
jgi:hypothetical protein